jgi:hypothetical protein
MYAMTDAAWEAMPEEERHAEMEWHAAADRELDRGSRLRETAHLPS